MKSLKILAIIGGGVRRLPGSIDEIFGTQSEARVERAAEHIASDTYDAHIVALSGGIACGAPHQETEESVLMLEALLIELSYRSHYLRSEEILLDLGSLTSAMNAVNLLHLVGNYQGMHHAKPAAHYDLNQQTLSAFLNRDVGKIKDLVKPGLAMVNEIAFVTFEAHFQRLTHIVRVGLEIPESELALSLVSTDDPCDEIVTANFRSLEYAQVDPLGVLPEAIEGLRVRHERSLDIQKRTRECPVERSKAIHRIHVDVSQMRQPMVSAVI